MLNLVIAIILAILPSCPTEDSFGIWGMCGWNAQTQGNGIGRSFVVIGDESSYITIYLTN